MRKLSKNNLLISIAMVFGLVVVIPLLLSSCSGEVIPEEVTVEEPVELPDFDLSVLCVGDCMVHLQQLSNAQDSDGSYSFDECFCYVKEYVSKADLALCNVETTFAGEPYTGYPTFSSPDSYASALKNAGFDVGITSNNHMYDKGFNGVTRTLEVLRGNGFSTTGSRLSLDEPRYAMVDVNGVKVATIAYTYQTSGSGVRINGNSVSEENSEYINSFSYDDLDSFYAELNDIVLDAKSSGAELTILYMHWGEEYQLSANSWEREMAEYIAKNIKPDAIFASHPHNLQEMEIFTTEEKDIPVFYSLGNFISNQRIETMGEDKFATEIGAMGSVTFTLDGDTHEVLDVNMSVLPTWVDSYEVNGRRKYIIIPLDDNIGSNQDVIASNRLDRANRAKETAYGILKIH